MLLKIFNFYATVDETTMYQVYNSLLFKTIEILTQ
jgi:hypothetical protein